MDKAPPLEEFRSETVVEPVNPVGETVPAPNSLSPGASLAVEPGARLGRYEIIGRLGMGGMGVVFEARDTELDRIVALKLVRPRAGDLAIAQARLRREAQAMARLSHPNVAAVFDIGAFDERLFIAMELVRGGTLRDHVGRHRPWRDEVRTLIDAGRGLAAAHDAGVIHRDFKPDNVLVRADGTVRVADFGLWREAAAPENLAAAAAQTASVGGTLGYMAPESFDGAAGAGTDQFAFAVTAFEVLEGHRPFEGGASFEAQLRELRSGRRRRWCRREVPARIRAAIDRGLAQDPAARWSSMSALCDALAPRRSRALGWALAPALVVAAAIGIAVVASRSPGSAQPPPPSFNDATRQQLTFSGDASLPTLSPDGRWLAYTIGFEPRSVAVQDLTTGRSRVVYHDMPVTKIRWSNDGARLLIQAMGGKIIIERGGTPRMAIPPGCAPFAWAPDDASVVSICTPWSGLDFFEFAARARRHVATTFDATEVVGIDWSRRDRLAVVTRGRAGFQVWTLRTNGTDLREVASEVTSQSVSLIRWSTDGDAIFYERIRDQSAELVRLEIEPRSGARHREAVLLTAVGADRHFSISGDGRSVAYARDERTVNLSRLSADGPPRALTTDTREKRALVLSRDRRRVAYVAGAGERKQILVAPHDGANGAPIPNVAADIIDLDWSPDGTRIAYSARRAGVIELWIVDVETGETRKLVHSAVSPHGDLAWTSPGELLYLMPGLNYCVLEVATGRERELSPPAPNSGIVSPQLSPDGRRIAVDTMGASNVMGLWSLSLEDGSARQLYHERLTPVGWSEDGAWVYAQNFAFTMTYAIAASGSGEIRSLFASPRPARWVQILPGERAALALEWVWRSDIWRIDLDGAAPPSAFAPPEPSPAPPTHPSLTNGDMSRGVVGRAPDGWVPSPYGGTAELTDRCHDASDRCAAVAHGGWLEQRVVADDYRGRRIRMRVRAQVTGSSEIRLWLETPAEVKPLTGAKSTDAVNWQTLEIVADVRPDARNLIIRLATTEESSTLFDDVSLEILDR